ncbi:MAG TPA: DNA-binding transcriptional regulator [Prolixibacteraceae bacterium]|nr:DNA-binding transcriptional regulator [Prolixibacteraceae bacterium]
MPKVLLLADFAEEYFKKILLGIARYTKEHGPWVFCRMPYYYRDATGLSSVMGWAEEWGADGIVAQLNNNDDLPELKNCGTPIIIPDYKERFKHVPNITGNYYKTGQIAAHYFLKKGYRHFGFYGYSSFVWSRERGYGFSQHLNEKGYEVSFFEGNPDPNHEMWYYKPSALSRWLESLPKPSAIMACDDNCGQQITEASKVSGIKIPEEIAVIGVDNDELICTMSDPPLSSIMLDAEQGGYEAAAMLDKMMQKKINGYNIVVQPRQVVTRQSTDIYATADKQIAKALKYIHQYFSNNLPVSEIQKQVALSRRSLEMKFKQTTGKSIHQYTTQLRIDKFCRLLNETDIPISEAAVESGFNEVKNIAQQFRKAKGCTPSEYRKSQTKITNMP